MFKKNMTYCILSKDIRKEKQMKNSKHHYSKQEKTRISHNSKNTKFYLNKNSMIIKIFIFTIIVLGICYILYKLCFPSNSENLEIASSSQDISDSDISTEIQIADTEELLEMANEMVPISNNFKVKDAEYLEFMKLTVNTDNSNFSTVHSEITNSSASACNNLNLRIFLYDDNKNIITHLDCRLNNIKANNTKSTLATLKRNLANCSYYSVSLIN